MSSAVHHAIVIPVLLYASPFLTDWRLGGPFPQCIYHSNWVKRNDHHAHVVDRLSGPPKNPSHSRNYQTYSSAGSQSHTRGSVNVMRTKLCQVSSHAQIEMTRLKSTIEYSRTVCSVFFFFPYFDIAFSEHCQRVKVPKLGSSIPRAPRSQHGLFTAERNQQSFPRGLFVFRNILCKLLSPYTVNTHEYGTKPRERNH